MSKGRFARRVTKATLELFGPLLKPLATPRAAPNTPPPDDIDVDEANVTGPDDLAFKKAQVMFAGESVKVVSPFRRNRGTPSHGGPRAKVVVPPPVTVPPQPASLPARGPLVWRRTNLPASSVQSQVGNPTGGLRLVQAGFRDANGRVIDQTAYFRNTAFGGLNWRLGRTRPLREDASARFRVSILGTNHGEHELRVSHKPTGEAGQNNYTTILHWGTLATVIAGANLVGKMVEIYSPTSTGDPFTLVIS